MRREVGGRDDDERGSEARARGRRSSEAITSVGSVTATSTVPSSSKAIGSAGKAPRERSRAGGSSRPRSRSTRVELEELEPVLLGEGLCDRRGGRDVVAEQDLAQPAAFGLLLGERGRELLRRDDAVAQEQRAELRPALGPAVRIRRRRGRNRRSFHGSSIGHSAGRHERRDPARFPGHPCGSTAPSPARSTPACSSCSAWRRATRRATRRGWPSKVARLRIFENDDGRFDRSRARHGRRRARSQPVHADRRHGARATGRASPERRSPRRRSRCTSASARRCATSASRCETGVFGARMEVELVNDGPVTIVLDVGAGQRVKRVPLTGMSGTGSRASVQKLVERGYKAVDTDDGFCDVQPYGASSWREDADRRSCSPPRTPDVLFVAGREENQACSTAVRHIVLLQRAARDDGRSACRRGSTNAYGKAAGLESAASSRTSSRSSRCCAARPITRCRRPRPWTTSSPTILRLVDVEQRRPRARARRGGPARGLEPPARRLARRARGDGRRALLAASSWRCRSRSRRGGSSARRFPGSSRRGRSSSSTS